MLILYIVISAAIIPLLNNFLPVLRQSYSLWLVPLIFVGTFIILLILHTAVVLISFSAVNLEKEVKHKGFFRGLVDVSLSVIFKLLRINVETEVNGSLPEDKRVVLVCNHTHLADPAALLYAFPELELGFLAKEEIKNTPFLAKVIYSLGGIFVERNSVRGAATSMVKAIKAVKSNSISLGIFPEGTRSKTGKLGEFKEGAFKIAKKTGAPLVVCSIRGVREALKNFPKKRTIKIKILKVFSPEEISGYSGEQLTLETANIIKKELESNV